MTSFAVLLAETLDETTLQDAERSLGQAGGEIEAMRVLSDPQVYGSGPSAVELKLSGIDATDARAALREALLGSAVDLCVEQAVDGIRPERGLLLMDVDSTLVAGEVIDELAAHAGRGAEVAAITERAMRGELDFRASLYERVAVLRGLPVDVLDQVRAGLRLNPGARTVVATLQEQGALVGAVSGGFSRILDPLADELGLDFAAANHLETEGNRLTGRVVGEVVDRAAKAAHLARLSEVHGLQPWQTVAVGDGANDLDMIAAAGVGIAYNAKPVVQLEAPATLNRPGLDGVLLLLGIARDTWASPGESPRP